LDLSTYSTLDEAGRWTGCVMKRLFRVEFPTNMLSENCLIELMIFIDGAYRSIVPVMKETLVEF
jgi:hypothetical protein